MRKIRTIMLLSFFFLFSENCQAEYKISIVATINNRVITNIDIEDEVRLINILDNNSNTNVKNIEKLALDRLVDEIAKEEEIKKVGVSENKEIINNHYTKYLKDYSSRNKTNPLSDKNKKKIYQRIENGYNWNFLISQIYSWKLAVNINEIDKKINAQNLNQDQIKKIKEKIIDEEKNKKLNVYSGYHLKKLKENYLIRYFK